MMKLSEKMYRDGDIERIVEVIQLESENEALRRHAVHRIGCESWEGKSCDCGLDALLTREKE